MKNIILLVAVCLLPAVIYGQITTATNFEINSAEPIDTRDTLGAIADTANVAFPKPFDLVYVVDVDERWFYNPKAGITEWQKFESAGTANQLFTLSSVADTGTITTEIEGDAIYVNDSTMLFRGPQYWNLFEAKKNVTLNTIIQGSFVSNDSMFVTIDGVDYYSGTISTAAGGFENESAQELHFGLSPAFNTISEIGAATGGVTGDATFTSEWNSNLSRFPRGERYFKWEANTGTVANGQWRYDLPAEYIGDTSKYVVIRIQYRSTGSANLNVWQNRTGGGWVTNSSDLVNDATGDISESTTVRQIADTDIDQFGFIINLSAGAVLELGDVQVAVIDPTKYATRFAAGDGMTIDIADNVATLSANFSGEGDIEVESGIVKSFSWHPHQEVPVSKALAYTDSTTYATDQVINGTRTGTLTVQDQPGTYRGKYRWIYEGAFVNDQHFAKLPEKYAEDTTKKVLLKISYILIDAGSQGNSNIEFWQATAAGGNIVNGAELIDTASTVKTIVVQRDIEPTAATLKALVNVSAEDTLQIFGLQFFVLDANGNSNLTLFEDVPTYIPHPSTLDTTAAVKVIVDASGGGDYTRLDTALANLSDGSNGAWNEVLLMPGEYWHYQVTPDANDRLPDYTIIRGMERDNTRVWADGALTVTAATDEDVFIHDKNFIAENFTIDNKDMKYCTHIDHGGEFVIQYNNMRMISSTTVIGGGLQDGQYVYFDNIEMETTNSSPTGAMNYHTAGASTSLNPVASFRNIWAKNMGIGDITDSNGGPATFLFNNWRSDAIGNGVNFRSEHSDSTSNLNIIMADIEIDYVSHPTTHDSVFHVPGYHQVIKNNSGAALVKGDPVILDYSNIQEKTVDTVATENIYDYVVYSTSIADGEFGIAVMKGKSVLVSNIDASYTAGDWLKCRADGDFEITAVLSERVAIALETVTTTDDLLKVKLLR